MLKKIAKYQHKISFFNAIIFSVAALVFLVAGYVIFEPNLMKAAQDTDEVTISLTVDSSISLSSPSNASLGTISPGSGIGSTAVTWTVTTNNSLGWTLGVGASGTPAMIGTGATFNDYTDGGTPELWSVPDTNAEFGFSASGTRSVPAFGGGTNFLGFNGATPIEVGTYNTVAEAEPITVHFQAQIGSSNTLSPGSYSAIITATATTL
jgi:hypothetical protein